MFLTNLVSVPELRSPKYHPDFADPTDDTVFSANDGTLFKFSSWRLARASPVFEAMRAAARPKAAEPIDLDACVIVTHRFLSLILESNAPISQLDLVQTLSLSQLADKYDCEVIGKQVTTHLTILAGRNPWQTLTVASDRDDVGLARLALSHCDPQTFVHFGFWDKISSLKVEWQIHLLYCVFPARPTFCYIPPADQPETSPKTVRRPSPKNTTYATRARAIQDLGREWFKWEGTTDLLAVSMIFNPPKSERKGKPPAAIIKRGDGDLEVEQDSSKRMRQG